MHKPALTGAGAAILVQLQRILSVTVTPRLQTGEDSVVHLSFPLN